MRVANSAAQSSSNVRPGKRRQNVGARHGRRLAPRGGSEARLLYRHGDEVQQEGRSGCLATPTVARRISRQAECIKVRRRWRGHSHAGVASPGEKGPQLLKYGSSFIYASAWCFVKDLYPPLERPVSREASSQERCALPPWRAEESRRRRKCLECRCDAGVCYFAPMTASIGAWPAGATQAPSPRRNPGSASSPSLRPGSAARPFKANAPVVFSFRACLASLVFRAAKK